MLIKKTLVGEVQFNDGDLVEIQTVEKTDIGLLLETVQINRHKTRQTMEDFFRYFAVGIKVRIDTRMQIQPISVSPIKAS